MVRDELKGLREEQKQLNENASKTQVAMVSEMKRFNDLLEKSAAPKVAAVKPPVEQLVDVIRGLSAEDRAKLLQSLQG